MPSQHDAPALAHNASPKLDSFNLWKTICMSRLLRGTTFILLLNKSDILQSKLAAGVPFARYVKSYKDGPNEFDHVCECEPPRTSARSPPALTRAVQTSSANSSPCASTTPPANASSTSTSPALPYVPAQLRCSSVAVCLTAGGRHRTSAPPPSSLIAVRVLPPSRHWH